VSTERRIATGVRMIRPPRPRGKPHGAWRGAPSPRLGSSRAARPLPMRVVVPWDRVSLGLELPVLPGKALPNPLVHAGEFDRTMAQAGRRRRWRGPWAPPVV
jgi:hypothetical protein